MGKLSLKNIAYHISTHDAGKQVAHLYTLNINYLKNLKV